MDICHSSFQKDIQRFCTLPVPPARRPPTPLCKVPAPNRKPDSYLMQIWNSSSFLDDPKMTFHWDLCYTTVLMYGLFRLARRGERWYKRRHCSHLSSSWNLPFCSVSTNTIWAWSNYCGVICKHKIIICGFMAQTPIDDINFSFPALRAMGAWHPKGVK